MTNRNIAMIGYLTLIGWVIAYLLYRQSKERDEFVKYHLVQSLGIILLALTLSLLSTFLLSIFPSLGMLIYLLNFVPLVFMILGVITAANEVQKPVPVIGKLIEGKVNV